MFRINERKRQRTDPYSPLLSIFLALKTSITDTGIRTAVIFPTSMWYSSLAANLIKKKLKLTRRRFNFLSVREYHRGREYRLLNFDNPAVGVKDSRCYSIRKDKPSAYGFQVGKEAARQVKIIKYFTGWSFILLDCQTIAKRRQAERF